MNESAFQNWISHNTNSPGVIAFGIHAPSKASFVQSCAATLNTSGLENAWRCVAATIPVLQLDRFPTARVRFVYGQAIVHSERHKNGTCPGIFTRRSEAEFSSAELDRLLTEFHTLS